MDTFAVNEAHIVGEADDCADELFTLRLERRSAVCAPHYTLGQLTDLDEQIAAYLDSLRVLGPKSAGPALAATWDDDDWSTHFAPAVLSIEANDGGLQQLVERVREAAGVTSALGWVSTGAFNSAVAELSHYRSARATAVAVAGCRMRRCALVGHESLLVHSSRDVRVQASRAAGELGRRDLLPALLEREQSDDSRVVRAAATGAAILLGNCSLAPTQLAEARLRASSGWLALLAHEVATGHEWLSQAARGEVAERSRIIGSGYVGDPKYAPWLIDQMSNPAVARIAAEAFVHITGADFNIDQLEAMPPEDFEDGPSDDPDDDDVELPEDIALPWPDVERIKTWWMEHRSGFTPGRKLFLGKPITPEHCVHVLKTGYQRQRVIAAHYRCLIQPGTVLFPTSAPAWRQQKLLAAM
jgi:uncharacterized protein (TIGR02270 family)